MAVATYYDLKTSLGKFRILTLNEPYERGSATRTPLPTEGSVCLMSPQTQAGATKSGTQSFNIYGKSGKTYQVKITNYAGYRLADLYDGNINVLRFGSARDYENDSTFGYMTVNLYDYSYYPSTIYFANQYQYYAYTITVTNPSENKFGYFVLSPNNQKEASYVFQKNDDISRVLADIMGNASTPSNDPYQNGGDSSTGGGTGTFDNTNVPVDFPSLPSISATDTGFIKLYNPTLAQLNSLANYLWSGPFDLETFRKIFANPMDCILGLSIVPVTVPESGSSEVTVGNVPTGISMNLASSQYIEIDCGTLEVKEYWGAYLDYSPFTKAEIYLPYIGTHAIDVDDIMNKNVHIKYHVDILSGACACYIKCGDSVLYTFIGQCASSIPISGNDFTNVINGVLSIAGSIGSMVASGGLTAPQAVGSIASNVVNNLKPQVEKSGSISGTGGLLASQVPVLILTRPNQAVPEKQNAYTGYPSFITSTLSDLQGYTEIESIHLENIDCTQQEKQEIESLLKGGVIL